MTELARPHVVQDSLEDRYRAMAADEEQEREALEWIEEPGFRGRRRACLSPGAARQAFSVTGT